MARAVLLIGADTMTTHRRPGRPVAPPCCSATAPRPWSSSPTGPAASPPVAPPAPAAAAPGLVASDLAGDPQGVDLLVVPAGGSARPASADTVAAGEHYLRMDGREVFRRAVRAVEASIGRTLDRAGVPPDDVDLFVPHQANARIVDAVLTRTGLDPARTSSTIDRYGNTSAASIPLALAEVAGGRYGGATATSCCCAGSAPA